MSCAKTGVSGCGNDVHLFEHFVRFGEERRPRALRPSALNAHDIAADYFMRSCADLATAVDSSRANISSMKSTNT
jgi:hypothetical protein